MSDIGIKGVAGFLVLAGTTALGILAVVVGSVVALAISSRRAVPAGPIVGRIIGGPLACTALAAAGLAWSWNRASDSVDDLAPLIAGASIVAGVVVGILLWRSSRGIDRSSVAR